MATNIVIIIIIVLLTVIVVIFTFVTISAVAAFVVRIIRGGDTYYLTDHLRRFAIAGIIVITVATIAIIVVALTVVIVVVVFTTIVIVIFVFVVVMKGCGTYCLTAPTTDRRHCFFVGIIVAIVLSLVFIIFASLSV